jgi:hypothetical protein
MSQPASGDQLAATYLALNFEPDRREIVFDDRIEIGLQKIATAPWAYVT